MKNKKTEYEILMDKHDKCIKTAIKYAGKKDWSMAMFYKNAATGYQIKARRLR